MSWSQFFALVVGWLYLFLLNNRTLKRSEISRLKDRLVDKINTECAWCINEIQRESPSNQIEQIFSGKLTQIELRLNQINHYVGCELLKERMLFKLRDIDLLGSDSVENKVHMIYSESADLIEHIEHSYDVHFVSTNILLRFWISCRLEILGALTALLIVTALLNLINFIFG